MQLVSKIAADDVAPGVDVEHIDVRCTRDIDRGEGVLRRRIRPRHPGCEWQNQCHDQKRYADELSE